MYSDASEGGPDHRSRGEVAAAAGGDGELGADGGRRGGAHQRLRAAAARLLSGLDAVALADLRRLSADNAALRARLRACGPAAAAAAAGAGDWAGAMMTRRADAPTTTTTTLITRAGDGGGGGGGGANAADWAGSGSRRSSESSSWVSSPRFAEVLMSQAHYFKYLYHIIL